jgi:hypothetical protein
LLLSTKVKHPGPKDQLSQLRTKKHSENYRLLINRRVFASLPPRQVVPLDEKEM